jgi:hypothetical protein
MLGYAGGAVTDVGILVGVTIGLRGDKDVPASWAGAAVAHGAKHVTDATAASATWPTLCRDSVEQQPQERVNRLIGRVFA